MMDMTSMFFESCLSWVLRQQMPLMLSWILTPAAAAA